MDTQERENQTACLSQVQIPLLEYPKAQESKVVFSTVEKKLDRAEYFLNNFRNMARASGGLPHVKSEDLNKVRANLDGFFFELISSKELFLQGINDKYAHLTRREGTRIRLLKARLSGYPNALEVVELIEKEMSEGTWLSILTNYRDAAAHRELLGSHYVAIADGSPVRAYLHKDPEDPSKGGADLEVIPYCEQSLDKMKTFLGDLYSRLQITD